MSFKGHPWQTFREPATRFSGGRCSGRPSRKKSGFTSTRQAPLSALNVDREKVIRALDLLGEKQMLEVKAAGIRHRYQRLKIPQDPQALAVDLFERMQKREEAEIGRLSSVLDLAGAQGLPDKGCWRRILPNRWRLRAVIVPIVWRGTGIIA